MSAPNLRGELRGSLAFLLFVMILEIVLRL